MDKVIKLQDHYANFCDELTFLHEIAAGVVLKEINLSAKASSGLANLIYALGERAQDIEHLLTQLRKNPLERFSHLVLRCETMAKYFDEDKSMMRIEAIWKDYDQLSENDQFLVTFMVMMWNPPSHRFPPFDQFLAFGRFFKLSPLDRRVVLEWATDPFWVMDENGELKE